MPRRARSRSKVRTLLRRGSGSTSGRAGERAWLIAAMLVLGLGAGLGGCGAGHAAEKAEAARVASPEEAYVLALRAEHRALEKERALLSWTESTTGAPALAEPPDRGPLFGRRADEALRRAGLRPGLPQEEALALRFLRRAIAAEKVELATAPYDDALSRTELGSVVVPASPAPIGLRDAPLRLAAAAEPGLRRALYAAVSRATSERLDPLLERREAAAQAAAREAGYEDYVALSEDVRDVDLEALLIQGTAYLRATEGIFTATLDRVAREELGLSRAQLRGGDLARLWKAPALLPYFAKELELPALSFFLGGIGLDLRTARGTQVLVDDGASAGKRPRGFVDAVDAPADVRLSVKPSGGLDDYWALFHEAGHAVHFASATISPPELVTLGAQAPAEAFGELFRQAFADPRFLVRYRAFLAARGRPVPSGAALAAVLRRTALFEMACVRRYAFARIAYELRLHGRPLSALGPALSLLPHPDRVQGDGADPLRELYRQLFSLASGVELGDDEAARFRADVDDTFRSADYARAFALAGAIGEALSDRFGDDWYGEARVGPFLRERLFAAGTSLTAEQVAVRIGASPGVDLARSAARAARLLQEADRLAPALQAARAAQKSEGSAPSDTLLP